MLVIIVCGVVVLFGIGLYVVIVGEGSADSSDVGDFPLTAGELQSHKSHQANNPTQIP